MQSTLRGPPPAPAPSQSAPSSSKSFIASDASYHTSPAHVAVDRLDAAEAARSSGSGPRRPSDPAELSLVDPPTTPNVTAPRSQNGAAAAHVSAPLSHKSAPTSKDGRAPTSSSSKIPRPCTEVTTPKPSLTKRCTAKRASRAPPPSQSNGLLALRRLS